VRRPLAPLAAAVTFTDATALAVVGLNARQLRTFVREHAVPHARVGRRMVVRVDHYLEVIDRLSGARAPAAWNEADIIELAAARRGSRS
jgi:hypothetical protein